jgi:acetyl-CoA C-acetyltransferase
MESIINAPYLLPKSRGGCCLGHGEVKDHMYLDSLEDGYEKGQLKAASGAGKARLRQASSGVYS